MDCGKIIRINFFFITTGGGSIDSDWVYWIGTAFTNYSASNSIYFSTGGFSTTASSKFSLVTANRIDYNWTDSATATFLITASQLVYKSSGGGSNQIQLQFRVNNTPVSSIDVFATTSRDTSTVSAAVTLAQNDNFKYYFNIVDPGTFVCRDSRIDMVRIA